MGWNPAATVGKIRFGIRLPSLISSADDPAEETRELTARADAIRKTYKELSDIYQQSKDTNTIPLS